MLCIKPILYITLFISLLSSSYARTFTDTTGRQIEATIQEVKGGLVVLQVKNKKIRYPIAKLSAEDQEYIKNHPLVVLPKIIIPEGRVVEIDNSKGKSVYVTNKNKQIRTGSIIEMHRPDLTQEAFLAKVYDGTSSRNCFIDHKAKIKIEINGFEIPRSKWSDSLLIQTQFADPEEDIKAAQGFMDHAGNTVIAPDNYQWVSRMINNRAWVSTTSDKTNLSLIDEKGKVIKEFGNKFSDIFPFNDGLSLVTEGTGATKKKYFINTSGEKAFEKEFSFSVRNNQFTNGYLIYGNGIILPNGEWSLAPSQEVIIESKIVTDGIIIATSNIDDTSLSVIIAASTGKVIATLPRHIRPSIQSSDGLIIFTDLNTNLEGAIDRTGKTIIEAKYKRLKPFISGFAKITDSDGKSHYINREEEIIKASD